MTGPEHYRKAEVLLACTINEYVSDGECDHHEHTEEDMAAGVPSAYLLAAQVHATLALAAATADQLNRTPRRSFDDGLGAR